MCGIAGIIDRKGREPDPSLIRKMTEAMSHRGPDADGFFADGGIALGHRRLSIIDLSAAANQPFADNSGRWVMVFNGELYNYQEVRRLMGDYVFRTNSDTEVIIAAYAKWGVDCLSYFRGMFAIVIWDRQEKEIFMVRDPMGVKPLYYFLDNDRLLFASEVRAILATGLVKRRLDETALPDYFSYQSISYPHTMIEGVSQLEAGSWMTIKKGAIEKKRYWDVTNISKDEDMDAGLVRTRIRELLLQSVRRRLVSDVPVGAFLSGGIDSSAVVGLMAKAGNTAPNTFNICFEEKEYDESAYAEIIARKFNTHHTRVLLKPASFLSELENALAAMDTPSGDGSNTYTVSKAIRSSGIVVALSGVGGDELFAGYPFFEQYLQIHRKGWLWKIPPGLRKSMAGLMPGSASGKRQRMMQILCAPSNAIEDMYPIFRQILSPRLLAQLTSLTGSGGLMTSVQQELEARKDQLSRLPLLSQVSAAEYLGYTQHTLLKDTDQMSMAASLEVREPFFDQDLVEYVLAIPDRLKKPAYPKSLLVESLKPMLPDEIVFRKKQGFLFPWNVWLKNELRSFCEAHILRMAQRSFIHGDRLIKYWRSFLAGEPAIRWPEIWLFVVLEYWLEKNQVS
jgi:asparagine synthase (glutamine-hydrolysing)